MIKEYYSFLSQDEMHTQVHCVIWKPDRGVEQVALLQLVHGMVEYIERYEEFAEYLCERGFVVCGHDHIGHGESVMDRRDWGKIYSKTPEDTMMEDVFTHYKYLRTRFPELPHFILGHSMGSYLLRDLISQKNDGLDELSGVIIVGTGTENPIRCRIGLCIIGLMMKIKGREYASDFVESLVFSGPYKKFSMGGDNPEKSWLTRDVDKVVEYYKNPKNTFDFSLNGYKALLEAALRTGQSKNIRKTRRDLPILFASGADDPVGRMGEGVREAFQKYWDEGFTDLGIELYENDRHEILNEVDRLQIYDDLYTWMIQRFKGRETGKAKDN